MASGNELSTAAVGKIETLFSQTSMLQTNQFFFRKFAPLALVLAASMPLSACSRTQPQPSQGSAPAGQSAPTATPALTALGISDDGKNADSIADMVETVLPSVVSVASTRTRQRRPTPFHHFFGQPPGKQKQEGLGSGVILSSDGLVVTNNHVVEDADSVRVRTYDDREYKAEVVGTDPKSDLAVLQLEGDFSELRPIKVGDSSQLRLGEVVLAIGNPFGVGQTVTMGIVSAKGRADMGIVDYEDFIQTDAAINPGNSGGALVNTRGELVGINTAILSRSGGYMGIGFAIPTNMAGPIIEALQTDGHVERGWLGVAIQDLSPDLSAALSLGDQDGVLIAAVQPDSPAARAGLKDGDVVTAVNGKAIDSLGKFRNIIAAKGKGKKVALSVIRDGKTLTIDVTLGARPGDAEEGPISSDDDPGSAIDGLALGDLDSRLRQRLGVPKELDGAVILRVEPGSKAAQAKLRPGDVILSVNRKPVDSARAAKKLYAQAKGPKLLQIYRKGARIFVAIR